MGKKVGWIYNFLGDVKYLLGTIMARNQEIKVDFSQVAGKDQAREILANNKIESFLMATNDVNNQMAGQKKSCEANCNNATKKPLVIGNTLVHWVPTDAKECHFCYQVGYLVSKCPTLYKKKEEDTKKVTNNIRLAKLYVKRNVPEENIKIFGGRSYANMAAFRLPHNQNNTNLNNTQKSGPQTEIDKLRKQIDEMAKLLNAMAAKLGVTIEKGKEPSNTSEEKEKMENRLSSQSTTFKSTLVGKKEAYNPELEIKRIKKTLEPILELLKQKQMMCSTSNSNIEQNYSNNNTWKIGTVNVRELNNPGKAEKMLRWVIEEQFDFKQMGTGVNILIKKCWIHHVETIKRYYGRLLHLGLKFRRKISVHIVRLYMSASKLPTERAVAKEIRKLLGDIKTYATNKTKTYPTATTLQHMNLVDTHGAYATNNSEKT
ncbi:hypothetical protein G9A89_008526 [Geosiphon pyriformis]|nr:hypothetical protein G9A89_008526 [Geosiphon pyriformis]